MMKAVVNGPLARLEHLGAGSQISGTLLLVLILAGNKQSEKQTGEKQRRWAVGRGAETKESGGETWMSVRSDPRRRPRCGRLQGAILAPVLRSASQTMRLTRSCKLR